MAGQTTNLVGPPDYARAPAPEVRPGDWIGPCGTNNFAHRDTCFGCGAKRPRDADGLNLRSAAAPPEPAAAAAEEEAAAE